MTRIVLYESWRGKEKKASLLVDKARVVDELRQESL